MKKATFESVVNWQRETFEKRTIDGLIKHLSKEVKELEKEAPYANLILSTDATNAFDKELADCFILLFGIADLAGINHAELDHIIREKLKENKKRKWPKKPNKQGVYLHEK